MSQPGIWSAPGGKYKKFCSTNKDLTLTWNYELGNLSFKGETGDILRILLIYICTDSETLLKDYSYSDHVFLTTDKSLHVSQSAPAAGDMGVHYDRDETKCKILSPVFDCSTVDELQQFIDLSYQNVVAQEISLTQATDSSTPFKPRSVDNSASLEHHFNTFKATMESKVAALLTKIAEQSRIIDKNNQELCKLTEANLHLNSRLSDLEEKVFPKGESTVLIHPENNVTHIDLQTNFQSTKSSEMDIHKNVHPLAVPQITVSEVSFQGGFPLGPSEKRHRKPPPRSRNLKNKARVFCPFLKRKGHCLKGSRCDFSHKFIPLEERGSKLQHNSFRRFPPVNTYPNRNLPPFPFNPNFPPPFRHPTFHPLFRPYHHQYSYPPPLMSIPTRTPAYYYPFHPLRTERARISTLPQQPLQ